MISTLDASKAGGSQIQSWIDANSNRKTFAFIELTSQANNTVVPNFQIPERASHPRPENLFSLGLWLHFGHALQHISTREIIMEQYKCIKFTQVLWAHPFLMCPKPFKYNRWSRDPSGIHRLLQSMPNHPGRKDKLHCGEHGYLAISHDLAGT